MKSSFLVFVIAVFFSAPLIAKQKTQEVTKEIPGFKNPESVIAYKDHLFVTNTGQQLDPVAKDGDGYISMLDRDNGKIVQEKFISGLNAPKGMFIKRGVLYVADVDKVKGFNIKTKKKVFEANLAKYNVTYANDITRAFRGMFVSSTLNNSIYKVKRNGEVKKLDIKGNLAGVNGLSRKRVGKLYVANYGRESETRGSFGKIGLITGKYKPLHRNGMYDGIARKSRNLYISDWVNGPENNGRLLSFTKRGKKKLNEIDLNSNMQGPSDIYADRSRKVLWVPAMEGNELISVPLSALKAPKKNKVG